MTDFRLSKETHQFREIFATVCDFPVPQMRVKCATFRRPLEHQQSTASFNALSHWILLHCVPCTSRVTNAFFQCFRQLPMPALTFFLLKKFPQKLCYFVGASALWNIVVGLCQLSVKYSPSSLLCLSQSHRYSQQNYAEVPRAAVKDLHLLCCRKIVLYHLYT